MTTKKIPNRTKFILFGTVKIIIIAFLVLSIFFDLVFTEYVFSEALPSTYEILVMNIPDILLVLFILLSFVFLKEKYRRYRMLVWSIGGLCLLIFSFSIPTILMLIILFLGELLIKRRD